jgi:hypothetical protein
MWQAYASDDNELTKELLIDRLHLEREDNQTETKTRTYEDCFTGFQGDLLLAVIFSPPEAGLSIMTLADPEVKQWISDFCHFYHEKTGIWLTGKPPNDEYEESLLEQYIGEFIKTYSVPEALKKLWDLN